MRYVLFKKESYSTHHYQKSHSKLRFYGIVKQMLQSPFMQLISFSFNWVQYESWLNFSASLLELSFFENNLTWDDFYYINFLLRHSKICVKITSDVYTKYIPVKSWPCSSKNIIAKLAKVGLIFSWICRKYFYNFLSINFWQNLESWTQLLPKSRKLGSTFGFLPKVELKFSGFWRKLIFSGKPWKHRIF